MTNYEGFPIWLNIAIAEIGVTEIEGDEQHNERILEYLRTCEELHDSYKGKDETAWCAAFANWVFEQSNIQGLNTAWALSWNNWGQKVENPKTGDLAVFSRVNKSGEKGGHVGFFIRDNGGTINLLGGNQNNSVNISTYPKNDTKGTMRYKLLSYRRPKGF